MEQVLGAPPNGTAGAAGVEHVQQVHLQVWPKVRAADRLRTGSPCEPARSPKLGSCISVIILDGSSRGCEGMSLADVGADW